MSATTLGTVPRQARGGPTLLRVYVWQWPVRITHWGIFFSMMVLAVTGFYLGRPFIAVPEGMARTHFVTGNVKVIHFYAAIVFSVCLAARMVWMFMGNEYSRWTQFIPVAAARRKALWKTFLFYVWRFRKPPGVIGHNPLAAAAYVLVFLLEWVMVITGLAIYAASTDVRSPIHFLAGLGPALGGIAMLRWTHHVVMYLLLGFVVHHVYSGVLVAVIERNATIESIVSGMKVISEEDLLEPVPDEDIEEPPG